MNAAPLTSLHPSEAERSQVAEASRDALSLRRTTVSELMNRNVVYVRPELPLRAALELFEQTGAEALAIVNDRGQSLGMLDRQLARYAAQQGTEAQRTARAIADLSVPESIVIREHLPATQAAGLMVYEAVQRMPVVSCDERVVGVLSAADILHWLALSDGFVLPSPQR